MAEKIDYSILNKFDFKIQPVGINFLAEKPADISRLNKNMALCEMLKYSQEGNKFYTDLENHSCGGGKHVVGGNVEKYFTNGQFGAGLKVFECAEAASNIYQYLPRVDINSNRYIAFTPFNKMTGDPDVLVILADNSQTEILLRALTYKKGTIWESKSSTVIGCAWIIVYPYVTQNLNFCITGLGHGMKRRNLFPPAMQFISLPKKMIASLLDTLQEMPWILPAYKPDGDEYVKQLLNSLINDNK